MDAKVGLRIHDGNPAIDAVAARYIDVLERYRRQFFQPSVDHAEATFFEERGRIGFVDGVLEQEWNHVLQCFERIDPVTICELLQIADPVTELLEPQLEPFPLLGLAFSARHRPHTGGLPVEIFDRVGNEIMGSALGSHLASSSYCSLTFIANERTVTLSNLACNKIIFLYHWRSNRAIVTRQALF